jgi:hypothetical protein
MKRYLAALEVVRQREAGPAVMRTSVLEVPAVLKISADAAANSGACQATAPA